MKLFWAAVWTLVGVSPLGSFLGFKVAAAVAPLVFIVFFALITLIGDVLSIKATQVEQSELLKVLAVQGATPAMPSSTPEERARAREYSPETTDWGVFSR